MSGKTGPPPGLPYSDPAYPPPPNPAWPANPNQPGTQYGAPQQQGYMYNHPGTYGQQSSTTVVVQPGVFIANTFREMPVRTRCPHCSAEIVTQTHYETGTFSWVVCLVLCFVGCNLGCCLIPFCVDGCKDVCHSCPNCQQQIARWSRM